MMSLKKVLFASVAVAFVAAVAVATPQRASAGVGGSPGALGARADVAGHGFGLTASITDGTSNTIATPANAVLARKAGGGQQEYVRLPESLPAPPFVPMPYPVSSRR